MRLRPYNTFWHDFNFKTSFPDLIPALPYKIDDLFFCGNCFTKIFQSMGQIEV
jgi:hypothetical protein